MRVTRETLGVAYRDGRLIAGSVLVVETVERTRALVPIAGGHTGVKDLDTRHPSSIRFEAITDELAEDLGSLIAGACDIELRRRQRDQQWAPAAVDLCLIDERNVIGCRIGHPILALPLAPELVSFPVRHPDL